ncbi:hypothetical protein PQR72_27815 [Paraburkholderia madseniana]|uniref:hypothetical protein n=1 Tax=Paraburkholderia madseniana TaxID=2599607 RepID=UPI000BE35355|nr:hypothetical protein [Paraburkholderia madseniana]NPT69123.1 hypothetical protein [Paraburkholderia madseniana]
MIDVFRFAAADSSGRRSFLFSGPRKTSIFRNTAIRTALTITIAGYTAALMPVIATSIAGLKTANTEFDRIYSEEKSPHGSEVAATQQCAAAT